MSDTMQQHIVTCLKSGIRIDGRRLDEFRQVALEYDVSGTAEGSACVKLGDTEVIVGIKLMIDKPFPDTPEDGAIMVGAELLPLSSAHFELGPPSIEAIELARVVDRGIRESKAIDLKALCIKKGEKIWMVSVDICTINDAGNLLDASALATVAALQHTFFPQYEDDEIDYTIKTDKQLELHKIPVAVTVYKLGGHFLVDPLPEEEVASDARLTITTTQDGTICALQKGGTASLTLEDIDTMVGLALLRSKELRQLLK